MKGKKFGNKRIIKKAWLKKYKNAIEPQNHYVIFWSPTTGHSLTPDYSSIIGITCQNIAYEFSETKRNFRKWMRKKTHHETEIDMKYMFVSEAKC